MRRQGASIFIYIIFTILIIVFVINFGPQSPGSGQGCAGGAGDDTALTVNGTKVRFPTSFRVVYSFFKSMYAAPEQQAKTTALEVLVRRELLATEADARGLVVTEEMVHDAIKRGQIFIGGQRRDVRNQFFDESGFFNYKRGFEPFVASLNVTRSVFVEEQQRELLAAMMAESMRDAVVVSRDEALAEFLHENNTATYDVVTFSPRAYRNALIISEADVTQYAAAHAAEIADQYKTDERLYKGVKPQVHVRQIFIAKAAAAAPDAVDPGQGKLTAARAEIAASKKTFAEVAKQLSSNEAERANGGDLGWRTLDAPTLAETALNDAVKALKVGEVSEVITTSRGSYLVTVQDKREGDLTLEQVKAEIALEQAKDDWSKEAARRAAVAALDAAQRSEIKNLNVLYKAEPAPGIDLQQLINDPNLTPEMKQQLLQQYLKTQGDKSGSLTFESENVPAAWAEEPATAGAEAGAASAPAADAAAPVAAVAESDLMAPSNEPIPAIAPVAPPKVTRIGPTPRSTRLPELGSSAAAARAMFDELAAGELAKRIYEADGAFVVAQLIERKSPKMEDFDKDAEQRVRGLRDARSQEMLEGWLKERCQAAAKANKIKPNPSLTREFDENGKPGATFYTPCMSFR